MKTAIVTSICGPNQRALVNPDYGSESDSVDYHAFVDQAATSTYPKSGEYERWNIHPVYEFSNDPNYSYRRNAKIFKILPELFIPGYDMYIYQDPSHNTVEVPHTIYNILTNRGKSFGVFKHQYRDCIYEESIHIMNAGKDRQMAITDQVNHYYDSGNGMPRNFGLYELPAFVKIASPHTLRLSLAWWEQICRFSSRDQMSLPYIFWKFGEPPNVLDGLAFNEKGTDHSNDIIRYMD